MSTVFVNISRSLIVILIPFMTPETAIVYSRDQLLMLQNHAVLLNHGQCSTISQLCLRRRGCRAGAHLRRRLWTANQAASSAGMMTTHGEIPVVVGHRINTVNRNQLFQRRHDPGVSVLRYLVYIASSTNMPAFPLHPPHPHPALCLDERSDLPPVTTCNYISQVRTP